MDYSLVIPHRNSPELLRRCLDSIPAGWGQVIVVDDGSDSAPIDARVFAAQYPEVEFIFSEHKGAGAARNLGLQYARGEWLLFADADDFFLDGWTGVIAQYRNSDADIVYFGATSVDSETLLPSGRAKKHELALRAYYNYDDERRDIVRYRSWVPWARMFRRSLIERHDIQFEEIAIGNDAMFSIRAGYYARKIKVEKRAVYCVTTNANSITYSNARICRERAACQLTARINTFLVPRGKIHFTFQVISMINRARKCGPLELFRFIGYQFSEGRGRAAWRNIFYWATHKRLKWN